MRLRKTLGQWSLPSDVTFVTGASLLYELADAVEELAYLRDIKPDAIRYHARTHPKWSFGDGPGQVPYGKMGNARTMATPYFLEFYLTEYAPSGRGPDLKPRKKPRGVS